MTGAAVVNSPHAFMSIRNFFVSKYLTPELGKLPTRNMKLAWQILVMFNAALEIHHGDKMVSKEIYAKMWDKYTSWAKGICVEGDAGVKIDAKTDYLSEQYFLTSDENTRSFMRRAYPLVKSFGKSGEQRNLQ